MTMESILNNTEKLNSDPYGIAISVPVQLEHPKLQKVDFRLIKGAASELLEKQKQEINDENRDKGFNWRGKLFIKKITIYIIISFIGIGMIAAFTKGIGTGLLSLFAFLLIIFFIVDLYYVLKQQKPNSLEELELLIYENFLHITSIDNLGNDIKFETLGRVESDSNPREAIMQAYQMKADAIIGFKINHSSSTTVHNNKVSGGISSRVKHYYDGQGTAVKLI